MRDLARALALPLHPILFACFPIISLASANLGELPPVSAVRSLTISITLSTGLLVLARRITGDWDRAAFVATPITLIAFSYGHLYASLEPIHVLGVQLGRHRHLLPAAAAALVLVAWVTRSRPTLPADLTPTLNAIGLVAVLLPAAGLVSYWFGGRSILPAGGDSFSAGIVELDPSTVQPQPDIYYIILDAYAREDTLRRTFNYDNAEFISFLESAGFYVAPQSRANYLWTHLSLSASLNLEYIPDLVPPNAQFARNTSMPLIQASRVRRSLEAIGYATVGFSTGWEATEWLDGDIVFTPDMTVHARLRNLGLLNDFESLLLQTSIGLVFLDLDALANTTVGEFMAARLEDRFTLQREILLELYRNLETVPTLPGPKFVFAHSLAPHGPHIFDAAGNPVDHNQAFTLRSDPDQAVDQSAHAYLGELSYVTDRIQEIIDSILTTSERPVIIILQSDHGPAFNLDWDAPTSQALQDRAAILNAYYVPPECRDQLYPSITPVNSFRVVFNCAFGADLNLIEDRTYLGFYRFTPAEPLLPPAAP